MSDASFGPAPYPLPSSKLLYLKRGMEGPSAGLDISNDAPPASAAWERTNTLFTNEKAGMKGFDKDKVKKIIYEMSKVCKNPSSALLVRSLTYRPGAVRLRDLI